MDLIKLPMHLGLKVVEILRNKNFEPRLTNQGILSLQFTKEELDLITEIEIINPNFEAIKGIEFLTNLQKLSISTLASGKYNLNSASINDKDIKLISNIKSLKSLNIENQSEITYLDLNNLNNLEELSITINPKIEEIDGLSNLKKLKEVSIYGNENLYEIKDITKVINDSDLYSLELDLLNYHEVKDARNKLFKISYCSFVETISRNKIVSYNVGITSRFYDTCSNIAKQISDLSRNKKEAIILTEKYLAQNIKYDKKALENDNMKHSENGKDFGRSFGTNSAYNGIMFGSCVCEGYTRSMQHILKILNIKTKNVSCIAGENQIEVNSGYRDSVTVRSDNYHSIIRIDDYYALYCDPTWDAARYQAGDYSFKYCLLNRDEISKTHTLSFEEKNINNKTIFLNREEVAQIGANSIDLKKDDTSNYTR